ncbi:MAG: hypothetical protein WCP95_00995 [Actinomycetes bacterium]
MRRIVWVAIGAAGGIVAYRRAQQAMADAKERGVVLSAQQVGASAVTAVVSAKALATSAAQWTPPSVPSPGAAASNVLSRSRQRTEQGE